MYSKDIYNNWKKTLRWYNTHIIYVPCQLSRQSISALDSNISNLGLQTTGWSLLTNTFEVPTLSLISRMHSSSRFCTVKVPLQPATSYRKFFSIIFPFSVRPTSGWNCTPYSFLDSLAIPSWKKQSQNILCWRYNKGYNSFLKIFFLC